MFLFEIIICSFIRCWYDIVHWCLDLVGLFMWWRTRRYVNRIKKFHDSLQNKTTEDFQKSFRAMPKDLRTYRLKEMYLRIALLENRCAHLFDNNEFLDDEMRQIMLLMKKQFMRWYKLIREELERDDTSSTTETDATKKTVSTNSGSS